MKHVFSAYLLLHTLLLIAPPEGDFFSFDSRARKDSSRAQKSEIEQRRTRQEVSRPSARQPETRQHEIERLLPHEHQVNGRSSFEDELKTAFDARKRNPKLTREKSLRQAKELWEKSQNSHVPARDFVMHLKDRYEASLHDIYSGEKNSFARKEFEADLQEINPFLYKTWRDSFFISRGKQGGETRTDEPFFTWLDENPDYLTSTEKEHGKTPLEIAFDGNSPEMAKRILDIAENHDITIDTLIQPLIEKYKLTYHEKGENVAHKYLQSIYDLQVTKVSHAMFEKLKNIHFPPRR